VLRISHKSLTARRVELKVEGQLDNGQIQELERLCQAAIDEGRQLVLDLSDVSFFSIRAGRLVKNLATQGAELRGSPYLEEVLKGLEGRADHVN
jgi:anti-anti-sigma regulatory factor